MTIILSDNELKDLLAELLPEDVETPVPTLTDGEVTSLLEAIHDVSTDDDDLDTDINELLDRFIR